MHGRGNQNENGLPGLPRYMRLVCGVLLVLVTFFAYRPILSHDFINFDDDRYITDNRQVRKGLTVESIAWAFTSTHASNWHPLTWLSHMLDVQIWGLNPTGHHLTNLLLHILNTLLLFSILSNTTRHTWQSAVVAALFALHPLHVESVAWAAERKDVLSAFLGLLTIRAYTGYTAHRRSLWYLATLFFFILGLMTKPMLVTLPCVLLLLDYWPLRRTERLSPTTLILEKIPLFLLTVLSGVVTFMVQKSGGAMSPLEAYPPAVRIANALIAYTAYIKNMFWPTGLTVFYPHPGMPPAGHVLGAVFLLTGLSWIAIRFRRQSPGLLVGWLWYLGTLVPVIGLVQVGLQGMADRYTYIPLIGLFIMVVWGISDVTASRRLNRFWPGTLTSVVLAVLAVMTWRQAGHWQNSITLFKHALEVNAANPVAHNNLGHALAGRGQRDAAIRHYQEALRLNPTFAEAHRSLGNAYAKMDRTDRAIHHYLAAVRLKPGDEKNQNNLGNAFARKGLYAKAIRHYRAALEIDPDYAKAHNNIALAYLYSGNVAKAVMHLKRALQLDPDYRGAKFNLDKIESRPASPSPPPERSRGAASGTGDRAGPDS